MQASDLALVTGMLWASVSSSVRCSLYGSRHCQSPATPRPEEPVSAHCDPLPGTPLPHPGPGTGQARCAESWCSGGSSQARMDRKWEDGCPMSLLWVNTPGAPSMLAPRDPQWDRAPRCTQWPNSTPTVGCVLSLTFPESPPKEVTGPCIVF